MCILHDIDECVKKLIYLDVCIVFHTIFRNMFHTFKNYSNACLMFSETLYYADARICSIIDKWKYIGKGNDLKAVF